MSTRDFKRIPLSDLQPWENQRDLRQKSVAEITQNLENDGYNPSNPMRVFRENGHYNVVAGGHRLEALHEVGVPSDFKVPCIVEPDEADPTQVAVEDNRHDEAASEDDLFDFLDYISDLREDYTQEEIGDVLGWSRDKVAKHSRLLKNVVPNALGIARSHQEGRGTDDVPVGTFTERWFRDSGLYDLDGSFPPKPGDEPVHAQVQLMRWYCEEKNCNTSKNQVQRKAEKLSKKSSLLDLLENEVEAGVEDEEVSSLRASIVRGEYTENSLRSAIENKNQKAQNRAVFGVDGIEKMAEMDAGSVDCVVTDPPYGVGYKSHRPTERDEYDGEAAEYITLLDAALQEIRRVCKDNAHIYLFFAMRRYCPTRRIAEKYFDVTSTPLVWVKNNHAPTRDAGGGFESMYAHKYESILVCRMPNGDERGLNVDGVEDNVMEFRRPSGSSRWHDSQKPVDLLRKLISCSTGVGETVLDPFAGSGSTLLAAAEEGRHYIGFEEDDDYQSRFKRELRKRTDG